MRYPFSFVLILLACLVQQASPLHEVDLDADLDSENTFLQYLTETMEKVDIHGQLSSIGQWTAAVTESLAELDINELRSSMSQWIAEFEESRAVLDRENDHEQDDLSDTSVKVALIPFSCLSTFVLVIYLAGSKPKSMPVGGSDNKEEKPEEDVIPVFPPPGLSANLVRDIPSTHGSLNSLRNSKRIGAKIMSPAEPISSYTPAISTAFFIPEAAVASTPEFFLPEPVAATPEFSIPEPVAATQDLSAPKAVVADPSSSVPEVQPATQTYFIPEMAPSACENNSKSVEPSPVTADITTNEERWAAYFATPEGKEYYNWYQNKNGSIPSDPSPSVPELQPETPSNCTPKTDASEVCTAT